MLAFIGGESAEVQSSVGEHFKKIEGGLMSPAVAHMDAMLLKG